MIIRPLGARVLLKQEETEEKTKSGIVLPSNAKEQPNSGRVIEVGPGEINEGHDIKVTVKKGDLVIYRKHAGTEVTLDEEKYLLVSQNDLLAVIG